MDVSRLSAGWRDGLRGALATPDMAALGAFLADEIAAGRTIYPPHACWLRALELTPLEQVRVVILGQDPYHGPGQAHGLCFSVQPGVKVPPSLRNIYNELDADLGIAPARHGFLEAWARQGVLLLNTVLTVEDGKAGAHQGRGWEAFTDAAIRLVAEQSAPTVFLLWGALAQKKAALIAAVDPAGHHLVLTAPHPSPLSARTGFFGARPFSRANAFLEAHGRGAIDWALPATDLE